MKRVTLEAKGLSPLIIQAMSEETLISLATKLKSEKLKPAENSPTAIQAFLERVCREQLYPDASGQGRVGFPMTNLMASIRDAGKGSKSGRQGAKMEVVTKADGQTILFSFVFPQDDFVVLTDTGAYDLTIRNVPTPKDGGSPWIISLMKGNNPNGGEAVALGRPLFPQWGFRATFLVDESLGYPVDLFRQLVVRASAVTGLCGYRPACGGPFGRFTITRFEAVDLPAADVAQAA